MIRQPADLELARQTRVRGVMVEKSAHKLGYRQSE
jgi:hypothetical protein